MIVFFPKITLYLIQCKVVSIYVYLCIWFRVSHHEDKLNLIRVIKRLIKYDSNCLSIF